MDRPPQNALLRSRAASQFALSRSVFRRRYQDTFTGSQHTTTNAYSEITMASAGNEEDAPPTPRIDVVACGGITGDVPAGDDDGGDAMRPEAGGPLTAVIVEMAAAPQPSPAQDSWTRRHRLRGRGLPTPVRDISTPDVDTAHDISSRCNASAGVVLRATTAPTTAPARGEQALSFGDRLDRERGWRNQWTLLWRLERLELEERAEMSHEALLVDYFVLLYGRSDVVDFCPSPDGRAVRSGGWCTTLIRLHFEATTIAWRDRTARALRLFSITALLTSPTPTVPYLTSSPLGYPLARIRTVNPPSLLLQSGQQRRGGEFNPEPFSSSAFRQKCVFYFLSRDVLSTLHEAAMLKCRCWWRLDSIAAYSPSASAYCAALCDFFSELESIALDGTGMKHMLFNRANLLRDPSEEEPTTPSQAPPAALVGSLGWSSSRGRRQNTQGEPSQATAQEDASVNASLSAPLHPHCNACEHDLLTPTRDHKEEAPPAAHIPNTLLRLLRRLNRDTPKRSHRRRRRMPSRPPAAKHCGDPCTEPTVSTPAVCELATEAIEVDAVEPVAESVVVPVDLIDVFCDHGVSAPAAFEMAVPSAEAASPEPPAEPAHAVASDTEMNADKPAASGSSESVPASTDSNPTMCVLAVEPRAQGVEEHGEKPANDADAEPTAGQRTAEQNIEEDCVPSAVCEPRCESILSCDLHAYIACNAYIACDLPVSTRVVCEAALKSAESRDFEPVAPVPDLAYCVPPLGSEPVATLINAPVPDLASMYCVPAVEVADEPSAEPLDAERDSKPVTESSDSISEINDFVAGSAEMVSGKMEFVGESEGFTPPVCELAAETANVTVELTDPMEAVVLPAVASLHHAMCESVVESGAEHLAFSGRHSTEIVAAAVPTSECVSTQETVGGPTDQPAERVIEDTALVHADAPADSNSATIQGAGKPATPTVCPDPELVDEPSLHAAVPPTFAESVPSVPAVCSAVLIPAVLIAPAPGPIVEDADDTRSSPCGIDHVSPAAAVENITTTATMDPLLSATERDDQSSESFSVAPSSRSLSFSVASMVPSVQRTPQEIVGISPTTANVESEEVESGTSFAAPPIPPLDFRRLSTPTAVRKSRFQPSWLPQEQQPSTPSPGARNTTTAAQSLPTDEASWKDNGSKEESNSVEDVVAAVIEEQEAPLSIRGWDLPAQTQAGASSIDVSASLLYTEATMQPRGSSLSFSAADTSSGSSGSDNVQEEEGRLESFSAPAREHDASSPHHSDAPWVLPTEDSDAESFAVASAAVSAVPSLSDAMTSVSTAPSPASNALSYSRSYSRAPVSGASSPSSTPTDADECASGPCVAIVSDDDNICASGEFLSAASGSVNVEVGGRLKDLLRVADQRAKNVTATIPLAHSTALSSTAAEAPPPPQGSPPPALSIASGVPPAGPATPASVFTDVEDDMRSTMVSSSSSSFIL